MPKSPNEAGRRLDEADRRILGVLLEDGRLPVNELAKRAGVSRATAYLRFERLQAEGVVTGFRAEVDPTALGYTITAMILVNVEQGDWAEVREQLVHLPGFEYLAVTSGGFDFVVLVRVRDVASLRDVVLHRLHRIAAVKSTQTVFVLDEERRLLRPVGDG
jgi:Lrp/AsnC family transcriptional regulator, leucine-responsive regulatory protein